MNQEELIKKIIAAVYEVQRHLKPGYLEKVYRNALVVELNLMGIKAEAEQPIVIPYKGHLIGEYFADILVEDTVILELKAVNELNQAHEVQLVNYLNGTGRDNGLLINFGVFPADIKRKFRLYRPPRRTSQS